MANKCDSYQIINTLLEQAGIYLAYGPPEDKTAIASTWQVTSNATGVIRTFHITLRKVFKDHSNDYQIDIDDCSRFIGENKRIISVGSEKLKGATPPIRYYFISMSHFNSFDLDSFLPLETQTASKNRQKFSLKKINSQNNEFSSKDIQAISNLNITDKKVRELFTNKLRSLLENYLNNEEEIEDPIATNSEAISLLTGLPLKNQKTFWRCFC
ncbi:MAG: hypothetical protein K1060chlam1_00017 [Candidatus Anoxychlamydiales bacterium]|nr:hypothetical protein [Candidatus Anoxychlamydiales bacterium]